MPILCIVLACFLCTSQILSQSVWEQRDPRPGFGSMTYDDHAGRILLLDQASRTWHWDGVTWTPLIPKTIPPRRIFASLAFDSSRGRAVLFGGQDAYSSKRSADIWEWDGQDWHHIPTATGPSARSFAGLVYDTKRRVILMYGGSNQTVLNDLWSWDGKNWRTLPSYPTAQHSNATVGYDPLRGVLIAATGQQTGEWDGTKWTQHATGFFTPGTATMAYSTVAKRMFTTGRGYSYEWTGSIWQQIFTSVRRGPIGSITLAPFPARGRIIAYATCCSAVAQRFRSTWEWDGTNWTKLLKPWVRPSERYSPAAAYDQHQHKTVLFGGNANLIPQAQRDTWTWDGTRWEEQHPSTVPPSRSGHAMTYDSAAKRILMVGGFGQYSRSYSLVDTWQFVAGNWSRLGELVVGDNFNAIAMTFDAKLGVPVFVGTLKSTRKTITMILIGSHWAKVNVSLPSMHQPRLAYDERRGRTVLSDLSSAQTWEWVGNNWSLVSTSGVPKRADAAMVYDASTGETMIHGGHPATSTVPDNKSWGWNGSRWISLSTVDAPEVELETLVYDSTRKRVVMFGGQVSGTRLDETFEFRPRDAATYSVFGTACSSPAGTLQLQPAPGSLPRIGRTLQIEVGPIPAGAIQTILFTGFSRSSWFGTFNVPIDLGPIGMPGCSLYTRGDLSQATTATGTALFHEKIPNLSTLVGFELTHQAATAAPGSNPLGIVSSNAGSGRVGW